MYSIANLGLTVPGQQKSQGYFTSVGTSMGLGKRHEPLDSNLDAVNNPGVGNYDIGKMADENSAATFKFGTGQARHELKKPDWPGPGHTDLPTFTTHGRKTKFPDSKKNKEMTHDGERGPGSYYAKYANNAPIFSFGTRFNSSIRNKDHLRPTKVDGPGPGAYKAPGSVKIESRTADSIHYNKRTTFGTSGRNFIDLPQATPAPNKYRPVHLGEASHAYTIRKKHASDLNEIQIKKQALLPGPTSYNNQSELYSQMNLAKSMLGGSLDEKKIPDNGVPGPDAYQQNPIHSIPGFVIMQDSSKVKKEEDKDKEPVGPQLYKIKRYPEAVKPSYFDNVKSIGNAERSDMIQVHNVPGPGRYMIKGDFEGAHNFHMGIKTTSFTGKNMDMPGPGEYETDVIPIHHSNVAHFIGTSVRSDLGVGKAYMYPGPGEYEAPVDAQMDPRIRIAGTFGTQKKDTVIKKTFQPGPGSYDLPASTGLMPQYLRTEENRAAKEAAEAALKARLEI